MYLGGTTTESINLNLGGINNLSPGIQCWGSNAKPNPYNNNSSSTMVLSYDIPNLKHLNTESLNGFLDQCQQKVFDDNRIIHQISDEIKYLITTKLKSNPTPGYPTTHLRVGNDLVKSF